jgi:hypothetical protein
MADYVPSVIVVGGAIVIIGILAAMRVPLIILMIVAIFSLILVVSQHQNLFAAEYRNLKVLNMFAGYAPFIIISVVIMLSLFYIFFLRGLSGPSTSMNTYVPPANRGVTNLGSTVPKNIPQSLPPSMNLNTTSNRNRANLLSALERAV